MNRFISKPPGCDYISRTGQCFSQHEELQSVVLAAGIAALVLLLAFLVIRRIKP